LTDSSYTHLVVLNDDSGSMNDYSDPPRTKAQDVEAGTKALIVDQAAQPGKLTVTLVTFDWTPQAGNRITQHAWMVKPDDRKIAGWKMHPYGGTPLLDALGTIITETGQSLEELPEDQRPGRVIFVIGTDGEENKSREYAKKTVSAMITTQREQYGWDFVFIGADFDAFAEADEMGIPHHSTVSVGAPAMAAAYSATSSAVTRSRGPGGQSVSYSQEERDDLAEKSEKSE
jgi:hypothetical protein